jgi:hypothetical protein
MHAHAHTHSLTRSRASAHLCRYTCTAARGCRDCRLKSAPLARCANATAACNASYAQRRTRTAVSRRRLVRCETGRSWCAFALASACARLRRRVASHSPSGLGPRLAASGAQGRVPAGSLRLVQTAPNDALVLKSKGKAPAPTGTAARTQVPLRQCLLGVA